MCQLTCQKFVKTPLLGICEPRLGARCWRRAATLVSAQGSLASCPDTAVLRDPINWRMVGYSEVTAQEPSRKVNLKPAWSKLALMGLHPRTEVLGYFRLSLRDLVPLFWFGVHPRTEVLGYFRLSLRDLESASISARASLREMHPSLREMRASLHE